MPLSSTTQHAMPSECDRKWKVECLNTWLALPWYTRTYSVKLNKIAVFHFNKEYLLHEASRGAGAQSVPVDRLVVGSIPTRGDVFIYIYIFISSTWFRSLVSAALSSATQHAMPAENWRNTRPAYPALCGIQREVEKKLTTLKHGYPTPNEFTSIY